MKLLPSVILSIKQYDKRLLLPFIILLFLVPPTIHAQPGELRTDVFDIKVLKVIDGDTIRLEDGRLVRYLGINAPEVRKKVGGKWVFDPEPFGEAATALNRKLVEGKTVRLQIDPARPRDRFGRLLAYVFVENERKYFVNVELLKQGLAKMDIMPLGTEHRKMFWSAEESAWTDKRGVWSVGGKPK
jgi:micrococcal nuclease